MNAQWYDGSSEEMKLKCKLWLITGQNSIVTPKKSYNTIVLPTEIIKMQHCHLAKEDKFSNQKEEILWPNIRSQQRIYKVSITS